MSAHFGICIARRCDELLEDVEPMVNLIAKTAEYTYLYDDIVRVKMFLYDDVVLNFDGIQYSRFRVFDTDDGLCIESTGKLFNIIDALYRYVTEISDIKISYGCWLVLGYKITNNSLRDEKIIDLIDLKNLLVVEGRITRETNIGCYIDCCTRL